MGILMNLGFGDGVTTDYQLPNNADWPGPRVMVGDGVTTEVGINIYPQGNTIIKNTAGTLAVLALTTDYTISGNVLTLNSAPAAGVTIHNAVTPVLYKTVSGVQSLLTAGGASNLALYSQDFSQAATWVKQALIDQPLANSATDPLGGSTAETIIENSVTSGAHYLQQTVNGLTATTQPYAASCYVKAIGRSWCLVYMTASIFAFFNTTTGAVGNLGGSATAITPEDAGNGWWRVGITSTLPTSTAAIRVGPANANGASTYAGGIGTSAMSVWGFQLETGTTMGTYIPTTSTPMVGGDYTISASGIITMGTALPSGALLSGDLSTLDRN